MFNVAIVTMTLIAGLLMIGVIFSLGMYMKGLTAIAFPGLGLIIATPVILAAFLTAEIVVVLLTARMVQHLSPEQVQSWMVKLF